MNEKVDYIRIANAELRYYFGIQDPDSLSDEEWALRVKEIEYIRRKEAEPYNNQK